MRCGAWLIISRVCGVEGSSRSSSVPSAECVFSLLFSTFIPLYTLRLGKNQGRRPLCRWRRLRETGSSECSAHLAPGLVSEALSLPHSLLRSCPALLPWSSPSRIQQYPSCCDNPDYPWTVSTVPGGELALAEDAGSASETRPCSRTLTCWPQSQTPSPGPKTSGATRLLHSCPSGSSLLTNNLNVPCLLCR